MSPAPDSTATLPGSPPGPADRRHATETLVRRLDWRFLMDDPRLGRVAYAGPEAGSLLPALRREAASVRSLEVTAGAAGEGPAGADADLAVLRRPGRRELAAAAGALGEGGRLYCELDRRAWPSGLLARIGGRADARPLPRLPWGDVAAPVRALGFGEIRIHLHYPSFEECREIVPAEPAPSFLALRRHLPWIPVKWGGPVGEVGAWAIRRLAPCVSLLAVRRPATDGSSSSPRDGEGRGPSGSGSGGGSGGGSWAGLAPDRPPPVAVTPRFRASGHVVLLSADADGRRPGRVVKVARRAAGSESLAREAAMIRRVHRARAGGFDSIPRFRRMGRARGTPFLVETGLAGRPMDRAFVRRRPDSSVEAVTDWLLDLHRATSRCGRSPEELHHRLVVRPLERVEDVLSPDPEVRELAEHTRRLTRPLARDGWPTVFEHGDLSHPNLLWDAERGPGVVDWEGADPTGLPAADLFFFLAYVGAARHRATSVPAHVEAFDRTFFRPSPRVSGAVDRYASGLRLRPGLLGALFVACWPRRVARLLDRLVPEGTGEGGAPDPRAVAWLRGHRYLALWRHAVGQTERLRIGGGGAP